MDPFTAGLIVLIAVFGVGNVGLIATKPKKKEVFSDYSMSVEVLRNPDVAAANMVAVNNKIGLLSERLSRAEGILMQIPLDSLQQRFDLKDIQSKIDRLLDFKSNAEIEIVAMRDALVSKGMLKPKPSNSPLMENEIRARVFNSRKQ